MLDNIRQAEYRNQGRSYYFRTAQTSQIYREIGVLEKNGWIEKRAVALDGKLNKIIGSITDKERLLDIGQTV